MFWERSLTAGRTRLSDPEPVMFSENMTGHLKEHLKNSENALPPTICCTRRIIFGLKTFSEAETTTFSSHFDAAT